MKIWPTILMMLVAMLTAARSLADEPPRAPAWGNLSEIDDETQPGPHSVGHPGNGIFIPRTAQITVDQTDRLYTAPSPLTEPAFTGMVVAGALTGDTYIIKYGKVQHGGACVFDGTGQYYVDSAGLLAYRISAHCGDLRRGYDFMVCRVSDDFRCGEAPWWNFRNGVYAISPEGVVVDGTAVPWTDPARVADRLSLIAMTVRNLESTRCANTRATFSAQTNISIFGKTVFQSGHAPPGVYSDANPSPAGPPKDSQRVISCREYQPEAKRYSVHVIATKCVFESLCSANTIPDPGNRRNGDPIDWNSPIGQYVRQSQKIGDVSKWSCWLTTD